MAAGKFHFTRTATQQLGAGNINLADEYTAVLLHDGYTPSTSSDSAYSDVSAHIATGAGTTVPSYKLLNITHATGSGDTQSWDADDISGFTAASNAITSAKWVAIFHVSATAAAIHMGFIDLNTAASDASVGGATQINLTWNANGIAQVVPNP